MLLPIVFCLWLSTLVISADAAQESVDTRGAIPLPREFRVAQPFDPEQSAGVFIGIGEFPSDELVADIPYAVDDAVDLAHLFSLELGLIPPNRVRLLVSGQPGKPDSDKRLKALKRKGVRVSNGSSANILTAIAEASEKAGRDGFFIVSLATHGFTDYEQAEHYLMTAGSTLDFVTHTGLPTKLILKRVAKAAPKRSLILVDVCREQLRRKRTVDGPDEESRQSSALLQALSSAGGHVVMTAAREGEYAYDGVGNGVFSGAVLDGIRCGAETDGRGLITARALCSYVNQEVAAWQARRNPGTSRPGIDCNFGGSAADLPLALCEIREPSPEEEEEELWSTHGEVVVTVEMKSKRIEKSFEVPIDYELNKHRHLARTTEKHYIQRFEAEPGFRITSAVLEPRSQHEVHSLELAVAEDKQSATLSFRLKSGPIVDRYRGWLRGKVVLTQETVIEASRRSFPVRLDSTVFGRYELASVEGLDTSRIGGVTIETAEGKLFAHGDLGGPLLSTDDRYELRILADQGKLWLELYSHLGPPEPPSTVAKTERPL